MIEHDDNELVRQCLAGNPQAFEVLVEKYQKPIFNVAYRMTHNYEDAEDITQSVFVKAYEKLRSFRPSYKFFSWIYRIAVNETLNVLQQSKRTEEINSEYSASEKTPDESYAETELQEKLQEALMGLSMEYQVLILLKHFQHFSYREIAYIMHIPEKKVKSRLFTARQLLRDILMRRGIGPYD